MVRYCQVMRLVCDYALQSNVAASLPDHQVAHFCQKQNQLSTGYIPWNFRHIPKLHPVQNAVGECVVAAHQNDNGQHS